MEDHKNIPARDLSLNFKKRYIIALLVLAMITITGQVYIQNAINEQRNDSKIINYAGRQRFTSQAIVKAILILTSKQTTDSITHIKYQEDLNSRFQYWIKTHNGFINNDLRDLGIALQNSDTIKMMMDSVNFHQRQIAANVSDVIHLLDNGIRLEDTLYNKHIKIILAHELNFLKWMDQVVFQYDREAKTKVDKLKRTEFILSILTLFVLMLEGLFIFRPAVILLRSTINKIINSEEETRLMYDDLLGVNKSLQNAEANLLIAEKQKYEQRMNEQKIRSTSVVKGQESERKRIAREIHDGLGQMLTALKMNIESIRTENLPEMERTRLEDTRNLIGKTIAETRTITFNLMPTVLSDFGIVSALKQLVDEASKNSETSINFKAGDKFNRLNKNIEIGLYRISQEAINNAVKYAQAKEITIELFIKDDYILLNIADNGKGFNLKKVSLNPDLKKVNNGIYNMQERTHLLDGEFKIITAPGKGTKLLVKIPVKYQ